MPLLSDLLSFLDVRPSLQPHLQQLIRNLNPPNPEADAAASVSTSVSRSQSAPPIRPSHGTGAPAGPVPSPFGPVPSANRDHDARESARVAEPQHAAAEAEPSEPLAHAAAVCDDALEQCQVSGGGAPPAGEKAADGGGEKDDDRRERVIAFYIGGLIEAEQTCVRWNPRARTYALALSEDSEPLPRRYVRRIAILLEQYEEPLRAQGVLSARELSVLFSGHLRSIYGTHIELLTEMRAIVTQQRCIDDTVVGLSELICRMAGFFKVHRRHACRCICA